MVHEVRRRADEARRNGKDRGRRRTGRQTGDRELGGISKGDAVAGG